VPRLLRTALSILGIAVGALVLLVAAAWFLMPKDWIDQEARRLAGKVAGATVRWDHLDPGLKWLALGVRIHGLYVRMPAEGMGEPQVEARVRDIFVSFEFLPLLSRRVEISAASVSGAGIALTERPALPESIRAAVPPSKTSPAAMALLLPRLDLDDIDIRTRDLVGGGIDIRRLSGRAELEGTVDHPQAARLTARAESLFWKPSARDKSVLLPSPLKLDAAAKADESGQKLVVERGSVELGPLESTLSGEVRFPPAAAGAGGGAAASGPELALEVKGAPQAIRSTDPAFRPLASAWPVSWSTTASWLVRITGPASAPVQTGSVTLKPISVTSGTNTFSLAQAVAVWTTKPDQTFTSHVEAADQGLEVSLTAGGSMAPGGATSGSVNVRALASRLNGLIPEGPTWRDGTLACRAVFTSQPPALPSVGWTATGEGLAGDVPGLMRPISKMTFDVRGDEHVVSVRSFVATVGSTTASLTGTVLPGKPLGTGAFRASLDKLVAEEWAPPPAPKGQTPAASSAPPAAPPPIPLRAFDGIITIGELHSGKTIVHDVVVPVKYADGTLTASPITGRIGTGTIGGDLTLRGLLSKPSYALSMNVKRAPVQDLAGGLIPFNVPLTGFASGMVDLTGPGMPGQEVGDSLRGSLTGTLEDGKITETPTIVGLRNALGLGSSGSSAGDLVFKTITHSLRIDRGRLLLDKVKGDVGKDLFEVAGSMGLDQSLNLDMLLRLAPERIKSSTALGEFARYARDKDGRLPINVKVTGTAMAPKFSIKGGKTLDTAVGNLAQEIARGLAEGGRHDSTRTDSTGTRTDSTAVDPIQRGREALKRLLGK
jgi:hypothetical protein